MAEATYESECEWCGERIYEGDPIAVYEGDWFHEQCADEAVAQDEEYER